MGTDKKIEALKKELQETQNIMATNMEKLIVRGQKIESLKDKSHTLRQESYLFDKNATQLKHHLQARNVMLAFIIVGVLIGALGGLVSGGTWLGIMLQGALGGLLGFGLGWFASAIQQKFKLFSLRQNAISSDKEFAVHLPHFITRSVFIMAKNKDKKTVSASKDLNKEDKDAPLSEEDLALLAQAHQNLNDFKKQEAENAEKLIERGKLLEQLNSTTTDLKQESQTLQQTAHQVERFEEAKNNHYTSIIIGLVGVILGALYGFIMGYSWPLMVVFGVLTGSLTYGLSTVVTKTGEKFIAIGDWFKSFSLFAHAISQENTKSALEIKPDIKSMHDQPLVQTASKAVIMKFEPKPNRTANDKTTTAEDTLRSSVRLGMQ